MARKKKTETEEVKKTAKNVYYQVQKTLKNGTLVSIKGYDKEVKK